MSEWSYTDATSPVSGVCGKCERVFPAIALVGLPERMIFGRLHPAIRVCCECKPRLFGRPNGVVRDGLAAPEVTAVTALSAPRDLRPRLVKRA